MEAHGHGAVEAQIAACGTIELRDERFGRRGVAGRQGLHLGRAETDGKAIHLPGPGHPLAALHGLLDLPCVIDGGGHRHGLICAEPHVSQPGLKAHSPFRRGEGRTLARLGEGGAHRRDDEQGCDR